MQQLQARRDVDTKIPRGGPALVVINASTTVDPSLGRDSGINPPTSNLINAWDVLVGFDRTPSLASYDGIVPAYAIATIPVPSHVAEVHLLAASTIAGASVTLAHFGNPAEGATLLVDWSPCPVAPSIVPYSGLLANYPTIIAHHFIDAWGGRHPPHPVHPILDQGLGTNKPVWQRPMIASSVSESLHVVTAANTLFNLGTFLIGLVGTRVVKRIYLSTSADTLMVIGSSGLTVGAPGAEEVWRGNIKAAASPFPVEFDEGMETDRGGGNTWRAYTAAIATLEITVIGG